MGNWNNNSGLKLFTQSNSNLKIHSFHYSRLHSAGFTDNFGNIINIKENLYKKNIVKHFGN